jgi:hypothetical protein
MRNSGPQKPPQLDSPHKPVAGDLAQITKRPTAGPEVPVRGPFINNNGASADSGSRLEIKSLYSNLAAKDAPPKYSTSHSWGIFI